MTVLHGATWHRGVDLIAVERVLEGWPPYPELTEEEQLEAVLRFTGTAREIAARLGLNERTVRRWRDAAGWGPG